jgi:hypothetical protein
MAQDKIPCRILTKSSGLLYLLGAEQWVQIVIHGLENEACFILPFFAMLREKGNKFRRLLRVR